MSQELASTFEIDGFTYPFFGGTIALDTPMRIVSFGAYASHTVNDFDFRNPVVGTSAFGSSEVWNPSMTTTLVPPFDSRVGSPADLTVAGGVASVVNSGSPAADAYGVYDLGADYTDLYVSCEIRIRAPMANYVSQANLMDVFDGSMNPIEGIYAGGDTVFTRFWRNYSNGGAINSVGPGAGIALNTWMEFAMHCVLAPTPPPEEPGYTVSARLSP